MLFLQSKLLVAFSKFVIKKSETNACKPLSKLLIKTSDRTGPVPEPFDL